MLAAKRCRVQATWLEAPTHWRDWKPASVPSIGHEGMYRRPQFLGRERLA
jgi:hypothetical protein